ncbi:MAG TPA: 7,8-didemethyl-8-hydroxy-5-deazariboflavin synthase CofG [Candidatus Dormibacteraeota bacterium]|nr:7,8-didemethyl-8-hydroxy-5-deazariboflavin synthase CofG [Candidatus Dormibacteraeota bacterium]
MQDSSELKTQEMLPYTTSASDARCKANEEIRTALDTAFEGRGIDRAEALHLLEHAPTADLLEAATAVRQRFKEKTVSFSKKVFIPLTTLCRDYCGYCTFRKDPGEPGARFMTPEEVLSAAQAARRGGCKEALFSLGDQPEIIFAEARQFLREQGYKRTLDYLAAMCELVLRKTGLLPHANPGLMSEDSMRQLKESNASLGLMLETVSPRLMRAGQTHARAPDKVPALRLRVIETAGRLRIPFTTGILIGIGETLEERLDSLIAIRGLQRRYGHIQEVIIQNFRAKPGIPMAARPDPSLEEMLRSVAIARLILDGEMNLQAPPNLSYADFPRLLEAGINDWGGISPVTRDFINPEAAWPEIARLRQATEAKGLKLRERLAIYPEIARKPEFVSAAVRPHLQALLDADDYARVERFTVAQGA